MDTKKQTNRGKQTTELAVSDKSLEKRESFAEAFMKAGFTGLGSHQYLVPIPTPALALRNSVVNLCVTTIASMISTLPVQVMDRTARKEALNHPITALLDYPNDEQTIVDFLEMFLLNCCLWGDGFAEMETYKGQIVKLWPMASPRTVVMRRGGDIFYEYFTSAGDPNQLISSGPIPGDNVLHLRWPGIEDLKGTSPVWAAEKAIILAGTQEAMLTDYFSSGARQDYIITLPPEKALQRLDLIGGEDMAKDRNFIQQQIEGSKTKRGLYLPFGYDAHAYSSNYQQAQVTEVRDQQILDIARFWRISTSKLNVLSKVSNGSATEAERIQFFQEILAPIVIKLEARLNMQLLSPQDRLRYKIQFNTKALLRADTQNQTLQYQTYFQNGFYTRNEIREMEGLPPFTDELSDKPMNPVNLTTDSIPGASQPTNPNQGGLSDPTATPQPRKLSNRSVKPLSDVQKRSLASRKKVSASMLPVFAAAVARCVRKEKAVVMKDATSLLGKRSKSNLQDRLKALYNNSGSGELYNFVADQLRQPVDALMNQLQPIMEAELDTTFSDSDMNKIKNAYTNIWVRDYTHSSLYQLLYVMYDS